MTTLNDINIALNQPLYVYQKPMFSLTVSVVLVVENGVFLIKENEACKFPGGDVRTGQESIHFAAVRWVKEQTGITLKKDALIPVDFRSDPERTKEKNVVDIGFVCILSDVMASSYCMKNGVDIRWAAVDFEKCRMIDDIMFYMDHEVLLERALTITTMMKE